MNDQFSLFGQAAAILAVVFMVSFLVESATEYFLGTPFDKIEKLKPFKWLLQYAGAVAGVVMAFYYQFDFISLAAGVLGNSIAVAPPGLFITGLAIGRGANFVHQFVGEYFPKPGTDK